MSDALVFPSPPLTLGQEYAAPNGIIYTWDGAAWTSGTGFTALWHDDAAAATMAPIHPDRSLLLGASTAIHFGNPTTGCPCLESDGGDLTLEVQGACHIECADTTVATFDATGLTVTGVLTAPVGGDLVGTLPNPTLRPGLIPTLPTTLPPSGPAGGDLVGTYPNPTLKAGAVTTAKLAPGASMPSHPLIGPLVTVPFEIPAPETLLAEWTIVTEVGRPVVFSIQLALVVQNIAGGIQNPSDPVFTLRSGGTGTGGTIVYESMPLSIALPQNAMIAPSEAVFHVTTPTGAGSQRWSLTARNPSVAKNKVTLRRVTGYALSFA